ncbi:hypothetical protein EB796_024886 [Bugula neritina]|uniref:Uncharacterized protein n=1 Tax=Bugula neritina TaxID=10212 RepID=A0A7J7IS82_BUGNE|nr:hypothetical protein EB796_024886 [Bugula neritina]
MNCSTPAPGYNTKLRLTFSAMPCLLIFAGLYYYYHLHNKVKGVNLQNVDDESLTYSFMEFVVPPSTTNSQVCTPIGLLYTLANCL